MVNIRRTFLPCTWAASRPYWGGYIRFTLEAFDTRFREQHAPSKFWPLGIHGDMDKGVVAFSSDHQLPATISPLTLATMADSQSHSVGEHPVGKTPPEIVLIPEMPKVPSRRNSAKSKPVPVCRECKRCAHLQLTSTFTHSTCRLKLKCDKKFPCSTCVRRGCGTSTVRWSILLIAV
jgi:hypothetical protein